MYTKSYDCDFSNEQLMRRTSQNKEAKTWQCNGLNQEDEEPEDTSKTIFPMAPSDYIKLITTSPENILCKHADCNRIDSCIFTARPKIVIFQRFEIGNYYNVALQIRNTSKIPHQLRLQDSNDLHFNITFKGSVLNTRLAPGMTHVYEVEFHPDEIRHYFHEIQFKTDFGPFTVPIIAVGPRALLAFPDQIDMGQTAVKVAKTKPILMRNVGDVFTAFSIFTDNSNFSITPSKGTIRFDEAIQIQVTFNPTKIGVMNGHIILRYESGDKVQSIIYGESIECDVQLVERDIKLENTYFGLSRLASIQIKNNSDYMLPYRLVKFKSEEEDNEERIRWKESLPRREYLQSDALLPNVRKLICRRVHSDEVDAIDDITFTYEDKNFDIFPISGEAWPRNSTNITVTFQPKIVGDISSMLYLDIAGLENRIALSLKGKCIGPALELNLMSLDVQEVYLCSTYKYEVICRNVGPISGTISYRQNNANFGSMINVEPTQAKIEEGNLKSVVLSFYSGQIGTFVERIDFFIEESAEILSFIMKGTVICPLARNEEDKVELSPVSIGFTMKKQMSFRNLSHAPIEFSINIPLDGYEDVITHEEFAKAHCKPKLPSCPREFEICPCDGTIAPHSSICVQLAYTPNVVRSGETNMQVELCNCTGNALLVPISFDAQTARFDITPAEVKIRFCFVNFPYSRKLRITNNSDVDGYFYILPQKASSQSPILYSLCTYQGYLNARQTKEIQLTVIVKEIGEQRVNLSILSLGFFEPVSCLEVICIGQGPVVSVEPTLLNWSEVTLLQTVSLSLNISNDSPIPAEFSITFGKSQSVWSVEPLTGALAANGTSALTVSVLLKDVGKYTDRLIIKVYNGKAIVVNLSAVGIGSCIVFEPEIFPIFDMGFLFSHQNIKISLIVKNKGNRHHQIMLSHTEKMKQIKKVASAEELEDGKYQVDPNVIDLSPGDEKIVHCKIRWNANEVVTEQWYMYATVEGQGKRELFGISTFTATFIEPNVTFDKNELTFRIDKGVDCEIFQQEDEILITNQSGRSLTARFQLDAPFYIMNECNCLIDNHELVLHNNEPVCLNCHFSFDIKRAKLKPQRFSGVLRITYEEHKQIDQILCSAQVNFPHLEILPTEVYIYCVSGYVTEEYVKIVNDSPLPVYYKISLVKECFKYKRLFPKSSESAICEGVESKSCLERDDSSTVTFKCMDESEPSNEFVNSESSSITDVFREMCSIEICECGETDPSIEKLRDFDMSDKSSWQFYGEGETQASSSVDTILDALSLMDKLLQIEPTEGELLPYTEQDIRIVFNGFENIKLYVEALCEIEQGAPKVLAIHATADSVRCEIRDDVLDFGLQLFSEPSVGTVTVLNQCMIPLKYNIFPSSTAIKILEAPEEFDCDSESTILVERQASAPGPIDEHILIEVRHLEPFIIAVKCLATIPQIYLDLLRDKEAFEKYPIEYGYEAVQLVEAESSVQEGNYIDSNCSASTISSNEIEIPDFNLMELTDENWEVILNKEKYPSRIDIDMAFERLIVKHYIESNKLTSFTSELNNGDAASGKAVLYVSSLLAPSYIVDMKYVVVNQAAQCIISLKNYGYEKAKIKLRKDDKKKRPNNKTFFHIQLEKKVEICQCESTHLSIIFYPKKKFFLDRLTNVSQKFFLEIKQGLTVPVTVKAAAVYPFVSVNTHLLNFDKVYTGQCREMTFTLKNQGFVDCEWDISIENVSKNQHQNQFTEDPFFVNYTKDIFTPGSETMIKVYFRPYKHGVHKRNLSITVQNGQEYEIIRLTGHGVERKLIIDRTDIIFEPTIPNVNIVEKNLLIKNFNSCPVEFYWEHLQDFSETNRIIRFLKHYYKSEEILIPERKIGEIIPDKLIEFYKKLVLQMFQDPLFRSYLDDVILNNATVENYSQNDIMDLAKEKNNEKASFDLYQYSVKADDNLTILLDDIPQIDEKVVEALLHVYVDKLQENPNFRNEILDPMEEIYQRDISEIKDGLMKENGKISKGLIIIFHGAPYTEYQEAACRSAKTLKIPLLNLNKIFLEALAYSSSEHVKELGERLERRYKELIEFIEKMVSQTGKKVVEKADAAQIFFLLKKIPPPEHLEKMDIYSLYEHKFEMICSITKLLKSKVGPTPKFLDKASVKGQDSSRKTSVLPDVEQDSFKEILRESLSQPKFNCGYILQTLNNDFISNEANALTALLEATGNVDIYLFITFHNSFEQFQIRACNLNRAKEEEAQKEIEDILKRYEDMTESEYNFLPENEKALCDELKMKRNKYKATEATKRSCQEEYMNLGPMGSEITPDTNERFSNIEKRDKSNRNSKVNKKSKHSTVSKESGTSNLINSKNNDSTSKIQKEAKDIQKDMKEYELSVNALLEAIIDWEAGMHYRESIRPFKNVKGKRRSSSVTFQPKIVTDTEKFFVFRIRAHDPWESYIYDAIVSLLPVGFETLIQNKIEENETSLEFMEPRTYSILREYEILAKFSAFNDIFSISAEVLEDSLDQLSTSALLLADNDIGEQKNPVKESKSSPSLFLYASRATNSNQTSSFVQDRFPPRWTLQPNESRAFKVKFRPTVEGHFQEDFSLRFIDNPSTIYTINIEGIAQEVKLDMMPESLFDKVKDSQFHQPQESAYILDSQVYDFGSILVLRKSTKIHRKTTQLKFVNISLIAATVSLSLSNENYSVFEISPRKLEILPNEVGYVDVTANTQNLGITRDDLVISIKDNNHLEKISLQCTGTDLKFSIEPKKLEFGRILLNRSERQAISIQNLTPVTVYWRLSNENMESQIQFYPASGKIKYNEIIQLEVEYLATKIISSAETKNIVLEILLEEQDLESVATYTILITAETYEIIDNLETENQIDFTSIPVESFAKETFTIKNSGVHEFTYEIFLQEFENLTKVNDSNVLPTLERDLQVYPTSGSVLPKKQAVINFTYKPSVEMALKSVPLFKCLVIEPYKNIGPVKESFFNVSLVAYYTRFKIEPQAVLNFGTLALKSTKVLQINIENIGRFPLRYSFVNQAITQLTESTSLNRQSTSHSKKDKKSVHQEKTSKRRSSNIQNQVIKWGPFAMDKVQGELEAGEKDSLIVRCSSETVGQFEEKLLILVPDSFPNNQENKEISLIAEVCVATIDFQNFVEIFEDSYLVDSLEEINCLPEVEEHSIFSKPSNCLYFRKVCVGSSHKTSVTLKNISAVPAKVLIEIQHDLNKVFQLNEEQLEIPAMSKASFHVTFSPTFLATFSSLLKVQLDVPHNTNSQTFSIHLEGDGHVPQIRILDPIQLDGGLFVAFGLTYVSEPREKVVKIQNVGEVVTYITLDINEDESAVYELVLDKEKMSLPCNCPISKEEVNIAVFRMIPNEIAEIKVRFVPKKMGKFSSQLRVAIEGNPYEITEVTLLGEGFVKSIVLYNLEIADPPSPQLNSRTESRASLGKSRKHTKNASLSRTASKIFNPVSVSYMLDYGRCYLNRMSKINFTMVNKTQERYFRFEWASNPNVVCTPSIGHLAPNNFKELTATFLTTEPITLSKVSWQCRIYQIILNEPSVEPPWDNRQTEVSWREKIPSSEFEKEIYAEEDVYVKREIIKSKEPGHRIVADSEEAIELLISAIAHYSDYQCNLESIEFDDTLMFESREFKFFLENTGVVQLDYVWSLTMDEHYPIRLDQRQYNSKSNVSCKHSADTDDTSKSSSNDRPSRAEIPSSKRRLYLDSGDSEESKEASDLFSNSAGLTDRSTDSWMEGENWPFEMSPEKGSLPPGESIECTLKFSPIDVFLYKAYLQCKMENLNPTKEPLCITVYAKSLLPYCHFEMDQSDYLKANRRDAKLPLPQGYNLTDLENQSKIRLMEFRFIGAGECHAKSIYLINPTTEDYTFSFTRITNDLIEKQVDLQCLTEIGEAYRGVKTPIKFTFLPESIGLFETYWLFQIKKYNLESLFLIVVNVVEPCLTCNQLLLKLGPSPLGQVQHSSFRISNNESCQLKFSIKPDSLYSEGRFQTLVVYPLVGILCPNSTKDFYIDYEPSLIGEHSFNVECEIEKLSRPVKVFITAQVFALSAKVIYIESNGQEQHISEELDNFVNVDQLFLNEPTELKFKIVNTGKLRFDYCWNLNLITKQNALSISAEDLNGRIDADGQDNSYLRIVAAEKLTNIKCPLTLKIKYGPTFRLKLNVSALTSPVEFSFNSYDFGPCYIQAHEGILYTVDLLVKNNTKIPCSLLCSFDESPGIKVDLQYLAQAIPASASARVPVHFEPLAESEYKKMLCFSVANSSIKRNILIKGEGVYYKIRLKDPCDALIDFGTLLVGKLACRKIRLLNEGRLSVRLKIVIMEASTEEASISCCEQSNERVLKGNSLPEDDLKSLPVASDNFDIAKFVTISPCGLRDLKPNKEMELTVKFKAAQRIKWLKAKFGIQVDCTCLPLTTVKAACSLANFYLSRAYISFGTIYEGCLAEEKFILKNDGDIGSRFYWDMSKVKSYFSIKPIKGYSSAASEIIFTCTYTPICNSSCLENKARLVLEDYANLTLTISGNCREIPAPTKSVDFTAEIRQSQSKEVEIHNDSSVSWLLKPKIFGDSFTAPAELSVGPKSTLNCSVTYTPLKETVSGHLDEGKLVVMLPDGRAPILYLLQGRCNPVVRSEKLYRQIPAKKKYIETFTVYNNSSCRRIFDCKTELLEENKKNNVSIAQINVPAKKQVQYRVVFYFDNEGSYFYKVWFDDNKENVQKYDIEFTVTKPEIHDNIELSTYVRSSKFFTIKIENPLEQETATFEATSPNEDIVVHGFPLSLPPLAFKNVQLEYFPLHPCNTSSELVISSDMLGSLFYNLRLIAAPAPPEKTVHVQSSLGSETSFTLNLKNFSKFPCEFAVKLSDPSFTCSSPISVAAKDSARAEIKFEPYSLAVIKSTVHATSDVAGEFAFPVIAQGTLPQPRGPFLVTAKAPVTINFKNPFLQSKAFTLSMDSSDFQLNNSKVTIASKKNYDITVHLRKKEKDKCEKSTKAGKLTVSCADADVSSGQVSWIFYIKGVIDN